MKQLMYLPRFIMASLTAFALLLVSAPASAAQLTYIVLYQSNAVPANVSSALGAAGGSVVWSYGEIGVVIARSSDPNFANNVRKLAGVQGAAATAGLGVQMDGGLAAAEALGSSTAGPVTGTPAAGDDNLSGLQWDMVQISAPQARAINGGSASIVVGDIDSGLDFTHPDLAPNVDFADSVSCIGGVPNPDPAAWNDDNGHGTHNAGTIAAAKNGIGIVGVAPNVRLAAIKSGDAAGFF